MVAPHIFLVGLLDLLLSLPPRRNSQYWWSSPIISSDPSPRFATSLTLTLAISITLGLAYILPAILGATHRRPALLDFALRASVTKATILVVLFLCIRHYGSHLGNNVADLMFGFAIFLAVDITANAIGKAFSPALSTNIVWVLPPLSSLLCVSVWTISLWDLVAQCPECSRVSAGTARDSQAVALELHRLNSELSKFMRK